MPPEKMDAPASGLETPSVRLFGSRLEIVFSPVDPKLRIHGHTVSVREGPMVFIGGRKMPVRDVY